jgi:chaperonin cofactor prefoldin
MQLFMDLELKITAISQKETDIEKQIAGLKERRKALALQRRKLETVLKHAREVLNEETSVETLDKIQAE